MKKIIIFIILCSLVVTSCGRNYGKPSYDNINNNQNDTENTQFPVKFNNFMISKLKFGFEKNIYPESIDWIDENNLLVVMQDNTNKSILDHKYIYTYNIKDKSKKMIYEGEFLGDSPTNKTIILKDGNIGLRVGDGFLIFKAGSMELLEQFHYSGFCAPEVSFDGGSFIYGTSDGIQISDIDGLNSRLLLKTSENRFIGPKLSLDGKLLYSNNSFASDTVKINVYNLNNKKKIAYDTLIASDGVDRESGNGYWFSDNKRILLNMLSSNEDHNDVLCIINTNDGSAKNIQVDKFIAVHDLLDDNILLVNNSGMSNCWLSLLNYKSEKVDDISPKFQGIESSCFSPSSKQIAFIGVEGNGDFDIFLITKLIDI